MTEEAASMATTPANDEGHPVKSASGDKRALVSVNDLKKYFPIRGGLLNRTVANVQAVDDVSFEVRRGETLGIVGESGCGKSTTARLLMRLITPDEGDVIIDGKRVGPDGMSLRDMRRQMQMVFQDSFASLNPRLTIEDTIAFGPMVHGTPRDEARKRARDLLGKVGLDPNLFIRRYPHELSGGQRQRINIARALALEPRIVILDEAVSALDKSVEAQVLNLLMDLKRDFELTYIFISHDLHVVHYVSDRVLVMYLGKIVEIGPVDQIYASPKHPYTKALLSAMPSMDPDNRAEAPPLSGDPPNPINPPSGCRFHTRCPFAEDVCTKRSPMLTLVDRQSGQMAACHMTQEGSGHSAAPSENNQRKVSA
jgi:peptide/nickel transport system ATP-binding protein